MRSDRRSSGFTTRLGPLPILALKAIGNIQLQFDGLRAAYGGLKNTLTPKQLAYGAKDLAEMDAGLDILQDAFCNYEQDIADGGPLCRALNRMWQAVSQASGLWLQEQRQKAARLR